LTVVGVAEKSSGGGRAVGLVVPGEEVVGAHVVAVEELTEELVKARTCHDDRSGDEVFGEVAVFGADLFTVGEETLADGGCNGAGVFFHGGVNLGLGSTVLDEGFDFGDVDGGGFFEKVLHVEVLDLLATDDQDPELFLGCFGQGRGVDLLQVADAFVDELLDELAESAFDGFVAFEGLDAFADILREMRGAIRKALEVEDVVACKHIGGDAELRGEGFASPA